jgi:hypothetical protein
VDLSDLSRIKKYNKNFSYILVAIDTFSRQVHLRGLKTKQSHEVANALRDVIQSTGKHPRLLQSDQGGEFLGKPMVKLLKEYNIRFRIARGQHKASLAERVQRTLKAKLWKYFNFKETYTWIDVIQKLADGYNNTPHSALFHLSPNQVNKKNSYILWKNNYLRQIPKRKKLNPLPRFRVNDFVRVSKLKRPFDKGYTQSFSTEVYSVIHVFYHQGVYMYELASLTGERLEGYFYEHEILRVYYTPDANFKIERVLDRRKRSDGQEEILVKWKDWHPSHNSWIPTSWVTQL